jgi:hypothetical protein
LGQYDVKFHQKRKSLVPIDVDAIYNDILDGVLPMKNTQQVWMGAQDCSLAFMQVLLETCSLLGFQMLDFTTSIGLLIDFFGGVL